MGDVQIYYDPLGFEVDNLGRKTKSGDPADGDTPYIRLPIRMLGIDTPETNYPTVGSPENSDARLQELATWLQQGHAPATDELAAFLVPRLDTGTAGSLQKQHGEAAKAAFKQALADRLTKPNGSSRSMYLHAADEHFDHYGRLLAYVAPSYTSAELANMSRHDRRTFNLEMVENGWAASLLIYPSLPKYIDLELFYQAAKGAFDNDLGAWADKATMLTGYEWRMCIKLHKTTKKLLNGERLSTAERYGWVERYCFDITTREVYGPQDYIKVEPYARAFVFPVDMRTAVGDLNLTPGA
jgi:endonuclease YncB( thermonuclease family)